MIDRKLEVVVLPVVSLRPNAGNARTHSATQVRQIANSIEAFGFTNPLLIDEERELIAGHGRLLAAKQLKLDTVPTIMLAGLSEGEKRGLRLLDNKLPLNAGWDADLLKVELVALEDLKFDLELTGFSIGEIDVLLVDDQVTDPAAEDAIPAVLSEPRTRPGDIWILGDHRIGCGDARDLAFLQRVVGERPIDAAFLDPPYNVAIRGHANTRRRHREFAMASGEMSGEAFTDFLRKGLGAAAEVSRSGAVHFVCMDWRHVEELSTAAAGVYGEHLNVCVWNKSNGGMGALYRSKHELVFVYRVGEAKALNTVELGRHGRNRTNVWSYASVNTFRGSRRADLALHPTVKPAAMVADALCDVTRRGGLVLDCFLGSGTTLIAAERVGRRCRGVEFDPAYVDLAVERWCALTNGEAHLERAEQESAA